MYKIEWMIDECIRVVAQSPRDLLPTKNGSVKSEYRLVMELLPLEKQNELLQLSLANSVTSQRSSEKLLREL